MICTRLGQIIQTLRAVHDHSRCSKKCGQIRRVCTDSVHGTHVHRWFEHTTNGFSVKRLSKTGSHAGAEDNKLTAHHCTPCTMLGETSVGAAVGTSHLRTGCTSDQDHEQQAETQDAAGPRGPLEFLATEHRSPCVICQPPPPPPPSSHQHR